MREYTFLLSKSFRTTHVKAKNLREAWRLTCRWYDTLSAEDKERVGTLTGLYQTAKEDAYVMSGWTETRDKVIRT